MSVMDTHVETLDELFRQLSEVKEDPAKIEEDLKEAQEILDEMKIEIVTVSNKTEKDAYLKKMEGYKTDIAKYRKSLLTGGGSASKSNLSSQARAEDSLEVLRKANAQLAETESVGINTLENLNKQKETIAHTQKNLQEVNGQLGYSNKLLNRMGKWWRG